MWIRIVARSHKRPVAVWALRDSRASVGGLRDNRPPVPLSSGGRLSTMPRVGLTCGPLCSDMKVGIGHAHLLGGELALTCVMWQGPQPRPLGALRAPAPPANSNMARRRSRLAHGDDLGRTEPALASLAMSEFASGVAIRRRSGATRLRRRRIATGAAATVALLSNAGQGSPRFVLTASSTNPVCPQAPPAIQTPFAVTARHAACQPRYQRPQRRVALRVANGV